MARSERDLTRGSVFSHVVALAIPTALSLLFLTLYNVTDTWYAGMISTEAQAGLGVGAQVFFLVIALGVGLRVAMSAVVGQRVGGGSEAALPAAVHGIGLSLLLTVVAAGAGYFVLPLAIELVAEGGYAEQAISYARWLLLATPGFIVGQALGGVLAGQGDAVSFAWAQGGAAVANVGLNALLVFGLPGLWEGFGLDGIAFATVTCQTGVLVWMAVRTARSSLLSRATWAGLELSGGLIRHILGQMAPVTGSMLIVVVGGLVTQWLLLPFGEDGVAAYGIAFRLEQLLLLPILGACSALLPVASQNLGARRPDRVRVAFWQVITLGAALSVLALGLVWLLGRPLVGAFSDDGEVVSMALSYLRIESLILVAFVIMASVQNLLQGLEKPWWPALVSLWRQGFGILLFGLLFTEVFGLGVTGIWIGTAVSIASGAALATVLAAVVGPRNGMRLWPPRLQ